MTPAQRFTHFANEISRQEGIGLDAAWTVAAREHKDLHSIMRAGDNPAVAHYNSQRGSGKGSVAFANTAEVKSRKKVAQQSFQDRISDYMAETGADYDRAFNHCQRAYAQVWNEANGQTASGAEPAKGAAVPSMATSEHFGLFRMPAGSSQEEFKAALAANGNVMTPVNPGKIFDGLVQFWQAKQGGEYESVLSYAKQKYPDLWRDVETLAKSV